MKEGKGRHGKEGKRRQEKSREDTRRQEYEFKKNNARKVKRMMQEKHKQAGKSRQVKAKE